MPRITFTISNTYNPTIILSSQEFKELYLSGIPLPSYMDDHFLQQWIDMVVIELQNYLQLKFKKQVIEESRDFDRVEWEQWGYVKSSYPCVKPLKLQGFLGTTKQVNYPSTWLSTKKTNDNIWYSRIIHLVPNRNSTHSEAIIYTGLFPQTNYFGNVKIPNYWNMFYITGWDVLPGDIKMAIGNLTAAYLLQQISDGLMSGNLRYAVDSNGNKVIQEGASGIGFGLGLTSKSISIDGLSQSYGTYVNGQTGIYGARLKQLAEMMDAKKPGSMLRRLYDTYGAITWNVC